MSVWIRAIEAERRFGVHAVILYDKRKAVVSVIQTSEPIPGDVHVVTKDIMNRPLIIWFLLMSTVPLYAQAQQSNTAKLKADAQQVVSDIRGDKTKTQAYCQINHLGAQMVEAAQDKDSKKAEGLFQRVDDLEKQLGPQYRSLFDALYDADPNSKDVQST